jgi:hypothetical protein
MPRQSAHVSWPSRGIRHLISPKLAGKGVLIVLHRQDREVAFASQHADASAAAQTRQHCADTAVWHDHAGLGSCVGACLLALLAWLLHSWRVLTFATSAIVALAACIVGPALPESPRWLLNNGRKVLTCPKHEISHDKANAVHRCQSC